MAKGHRTAELRSIEIHRLVAERLNDALLAGAHKRVEGWLADDAGTVPRVYASAWLELLLGPRVELQDALVEDSQRMRDLRQNTPFAGVLADEERLAIIRRVR